MSEPLVGWVTGAAGGIGRALCEELLQRGGNVVATDLRPSGLETLGPPDRVLPLTLDVRDPEAWTQTLQQAVEHFGHVDVLVNNAGYLRPGLATEIDPEQIALHIDVNVKGVLLGTRVVGAYLRERGRGHVINVASLAALAPIPGLSAYSATKYAVRAFSLAAADELRPAGVAVTVVCPDAVATPMLDLQADYEEAALTFSGPRVLSAQEVARAVWGRALSKRPLEVWLPARRGWLARAADLFPGVGFKVGDALRKRGLRAQRRHSTD